MLYKSDGITMNLDSIVAIIEDDDFKLDPLVILINGYTTYFHFDTSLDKVLFLKAIRTNTISEFYKFEDTDSKLMICNPAESLHSDSMCVNDNLFGKVNGNFIINILLIDFYRYIDYDNKLSIRTGDTEFILNNITREEYDKFDNFMIRHFGLYKNGKK